MSRINIKYMSDETIETLRVNLEVNTDNIMNNPTDSSWIHNINPGKTFIEKKHTIEDFELIMPKDINDKGTEIKNSIKLYCDNNKQIFRRTPKRVAYVCSF